MHEDAHGYRQLRGKVRNRTENLKSYKSAWKKLVTWWIFEGSVSSDSSYNAKCVIVSMGIRGYGIISVKERFSHNEASKLKARAQLQCIFIFSL